MPTVYEDLDLPGGDPPANLAVSIFPAGTDGAPLEVAYHDTTVVGAAVLTRRNGGIDADGVWSVDLPPVSEMTPTGMRWGVTVAGARVDPKPRFLNVPDSPGTYKAETILSDPPGTILDPDDAALLGDRIVNIEENWATNAALDAAVIGEWAPDLNVVAADPAFTGTFAPALATLPDAADVTQGLYTRTSTGSFRALAVDPSVAGRVWGISSGGIGFLPNNGTGSRVDKVANPSAYSVQQLVFSSAFLFLVAGGGGSRQGQIWRSPLPDANGDGLSFTKIQDLTGMALGTAGSAADGGENSSFRNACLAISGQLGYYCEYGVANGGVVTGGPSVYYCANLHVANPASILWTLRRTFTGAKHCHAVKSINGYPWVMIGDASTPSTTYDEIGLWNANDPNAGAWAQRSLYGEARGGNGLYGINLHALTVNGHPLIITESDQKAGYGPLVWNSQVMTAQLPLRPTCEIPAPYKGTMRGLTITSEGNLMWVTTGENGAVGPYDSIWIAKPPFTVPVMLESFASNNTLGTIGDPVESGDNVFFGPFRIRKEKFLGQ
jgi:hypothetical protein